MKKLVNLSLALALLSFACPGGSEPTGLGASDVAVTPDLADTGADASNALDVVEDASDAGAEDGEDIEPASDASASDASASDASTSDASASDASSDGIEDSFAGVGAVIAQEMQEGRIPGLAVAVTMPGEVVWTGVYGQADVAANVPVTKDTPFMLASVSKTVTAVAVMRAKEQGKLSLDEEVDGIVPFTVDNPLVDGDVITVRHLVSHTSGIRDNWGNMPYFDGDPTVSLGDYLQGYLVTGGQWYDANANFNATLPGTSFEYGNIATALAGYAVEVAAQTAFDTYCQAEIFDVLDMQNTGWYLADFDASKVAMPHRYENGSYVALGHYGYADYPDGQLRSSIVDIARFLAAMSNDGALEDASVLNADTVTEMFQAQVPEVDGTQYVFWYQSTVAGRTVIGHNGGDKGVATQMSFSPETGVGVIVLMNTSWTPSVTAAAASIQDLLFDVGEGL